MLKFTTTKSQSAFRTSFLVLTILSTLLFALPALADNTMRAADKAATELMLQSPWPQGSKMLDDTELHKVHGMGISFFIAQPDIIPAIILWDESDKRRSGVTSQTSIKINVSITSANTR